MAKDSQRIPRVFSRQVTLQLLALLTYVAFLVAGYSTLPVRADDDVRALPIFGVLSLLLLGLQILISENCSLTRIVYVVVTSGFAIVYAADSVVFGAQQQFMRAPITYAILNALLLLVFVYGAFNRRRRNPQALSAQAEPGVVGGSPARFTYATVASDFGGLALLGFIAWGPLALVQVLLGVSVEVSGLRLPGVTTLGDLDRDLGLAAGVLALVLLVIVGLLLGITSERIDPAAFWRVCRSVLGTASDASSLSLGLALSPLIWIVPALSITLVSQRVTDYLAQAAALQGGTPGEVFNPFHPTSQQSYRVAVENLGLELLAVAAVLAAVIEIEHRADIITRAVRVVGAAGRAVGLVLDPVSAQPLRHQRAADLHDVPARSSIPGRRVDAGGVLGRRRSHRLRHAARAQVGARDRTHSSQWQRIAEGAHA
jgi:hypothetical protein